MGFYNWRSSVKIFKSVLALSVLLTMLVACGDDSSSSVSPEPRQCEVLSDDCNDASSSSEKISKNSSRSQKSSGKEKSSSSVEEKSSSSEQGYSSVNNKNSSSSVIESSSDSKKKCEENAVDVDTSGYMVFTYQCKNGEWKTIDIYEIPQATSSDAHYDMTEQFYCNGYPDCEYASEDYTDPRDKQVYKTLTYVFLDSSHVYRVFAENLNYGKQIMKGSLNFDDDAVEKYCYNDDEWYCDNGFGGLYTWSEAMGLPKACDTLYVDSSAACKDAFVPPGGRSEKLGFYVQRQGICPEGWHVMNGREWLRLNDVSHRGLSSPIVWHGWNSRGFSALPVGYLKDGEFVDFGGWAVFFEPEEFNAEGAKSHYISEQAHRESSFFKDDAVSIRCVENYDDQFWE